MLVTSSSCFILFSELIVHWAKDFYEFQECELATVELVTESKIEAAQVAIQGHPRRIPDSDPSTLPSLEVCGPQIFPGNGESKLQNTLPV